MGVWRLFVGLAGAIGFAVLAAVVYYALSLVVLTIAGRVLPLAGRRRRR